MTNLFFGHLSNTPVPADENVVRMTTAPVEMDAPAAVQDDTPEFNKYESDPNPHLGMATRTLASDWHEGEQFTPSWKETVDNNHNLNDIVNRQVSSSGYAAQQEAAGRWGHGTASYAVGIEPVHDLDGGQFGNEYFEANAQGANESAGNYMQPATSDGITRGVASSAARENQREASQAALINSWYQSMLGGGQ